MAAAEHTYDVFISYSHKDRKWVDDNLLPRLEEAGLRVAIDYRDFPLGGIAQQNMEHAVEASSHVVLVMSPNWLNSEWGAFEYLLVSGEDPSSLRGKLVPLLIAPTELPRRHAIRTYADLTDPQTYAQQMARVVATLQQGNGFEIHRPPPVQPIPSTEPAPSAVSSSEPWQPELADLVIRSGRVQPAARRALCIEIGVDADGLSFIEAPARDFAVQLVDYLDKTGNGEALLALCAAVRSVLKGTFAQRLTSVTERVRRSLPGLTNA